MKSDNARRRSPVGPRRAAASSDDSGAPKAIILAAGEGRSLFPLTKTCPQSLLRIGETTILERMIRQLTTQAVRDFVVVTGYKKERVLETVRQIRRTQDVRIAVVENPKYAMTHTLCSLSLVEAQCCDSTIVVVDGDVICEDGVIAALMRSKAAAVLAVDSCRVMGEEEVKVHWHDDLRVCAIGKNIVGGKGEFLGISRFSAQMAKNLFATMRQILNEKRETEYYESAIAALALHHDINVLDVRGHKWSEIDFLTDYEEALRVFGTPEQVREFRESRRSRRQYLFCPGPVLVSAKVKEALVAPEIGHREIEFSELLNRVRLKLSRVYGVRNFHEYATVVITGSGSAANEAVFGTAGLGRRILAVANGEFGERLIDLAQHHEIHVVPLRYRWGQRVRLEQVEEVLKSGAVDTVCMVHHETSTGMLNPISEIGVLARRYNLQFFVDAVSSLGAVPVDVEGNGITFCTGSANKALASVPGLSFVCGRRAAFDALKTARSCSLYLDLYKHFVYNDQQFQTPNTPAVNLFFALEAALDGVLNGGLTATFDKYTALAQRIRTGLKALGFRFLIEEEAMCPVLTTVELPTGFEAETFHDALKNQGYITYAGKGILRDRVFQVANIGELSPKQVDSFLRALRKVTFEEIQH